MTSDTRPHRSNHVEKTRASLQGSRNPFSRSSIVHDLFAVSLPRSESMHSQHRDTIAITAPARLCVTTDSLLEEKLRGVDIYSHRASTTRCPCSMGRKSDARRVKAESNLNAQNEHLLSRCKVAHVKERRQRARIEELHFEYA